MEELGFVEREVEVIVRSEVVAFKDVARIF